MAESRLRPGSSEPLGPVATDQRWQFWIDRGGTFTDCLGRDPATGQIHVVKVLSSDRAPLVAIRRIRGLPDAAPIAPCDIRMGTTVATNALLERKGTPAALVITRGFGDVLEIGTGTRPRIFEVAIHKPSVLYQAVLEVDARSDAQGRVLARPNPERVLDELRALRRRGLDSVAIVLLHAYRSAELELELGELARRAGFSHVALSHQVAAEIGLVGRGDTTCLDASLTPLLAAYVRSLLAELPGSTLKIMQSSGGLTEAERFRGPDAILSGPAGGVVALAHVAKQAGLERVIGFDMGGTSTDVSHYAGQFERMYEAEVAGVRVRAPMMSIHTIAAGGGSLCRYDGRRLSVGPDSAGAEPGPLCYGDARASELSLTDVNLVLGRFAPERFPIPIDETRSRRALEQIATALARHSDPRTPEDIAEGFFQIANDSMAEAIRRVSVSRGYDVRDYALVVFGGAGGQHACALARRLGMRAIVSHPYAGVLSAYGMGLADVAWHGEADAGREPLGSGSVAALQRLFAALEASGRRAIEEQGFWQDQIECTRRVDLRYQGTETALTLHAASAPELQAAFTARHERQFGYARPNHPIEVVLARAEVTGRRFREPTNAWRAEPRARPAQSNDRLWFEGRWLDDVPRLWREELEVGTRLSGPALVLEAGGTIVVEPDFELEARENGLLVLAQRSAPAPARRGDVRAESDRPDPVLLEIMGNLYMSIAEQMGEVLRKTAISTNIRERLDFSCALFDASANLVANAPHIPVHLGAMGESVRAIAEAHRGGIAPGDVFVTNDPSRGGSHLPDVTVVTPVHDADGQLTFFTASRGHHADIGGITPGSMPPFSRSLDEEGVVLSGLRIVRGGRLERDAILAALGSGAYPARNPRENLADLEAQIAANRTGADLLAELCSRYGIRTVSAYMRHIQDAAGAKVADEIGRLANGEHAFEDGLDDGTPIRVALRVDGTSMCIDFTGTGAELPGNLNAPRAVTVAAVIYFLRTLVGAPIPLNSGCLRPVQILLPERSVLSPTPGRAVAGGNVETSQRVVDVLFAAAGRAAASQGTMNNLTFGDAHFGYYETIAGGAGAGPGFHGASAVQTHMTNTRITDAEVLEARYPIRMLQFSVRRGSGGAGRFRGGDGVVRELEFLAPMRLSILSERRVLAPFGLAGGAPGASGRNLLNGEDLGGKATRDVQPGDRLRLETPGGGGYGDEDATRRSEDSQDLG